MNILFMIETWRVVGILTTIVVSLVIMYVVITKMREKEEKIQFESGLLRSLLERIPDSIYFKDEEARFVRISEAKAEELGVGRDEAVGKTSFDFYQEEEAKKIHRNDMRVVKEEEKIIDKEEKTTGADGEERWASATKVPRYDEEGNVIGLLGISRDITRRKRAEKRTEFLHSLLRHDLKNKAQIVHGYQEALLNLDLPEGGKEFLEKAIRANQEGINLIEKVRALERIRSEKLRKIDVGLVVDDVISENEEQAAEKGIIIHREKDKCKARGGSLLKELISNLVKNSIQHSECNKIRISSKARDDDCVITVEDNGMGIPEKYKDRVFERGFKGGKSTGSGFGLNLIKKIAKHYNGDVQVNDSELGGARFDVILKKA